MLLLERKESLEDCFPRNIMEYFTLLINSEAFALPSLLLMNLELTTYVYVCVCIYTGSCDSNSYTA